MLPWSSKLLVSHDDSNPSRFDSRVVARAVVAIYNATTADLKCVRDYFTPARAFLRSAADLG